MMKNLIDRDFKADIQLNAPRIIYSVDLDKERKI